MSKINLRGHFPEEELDCFVEVTDGEEDAFIAALTKELAVVYFEFQREENASQRRMYYHRAHFSLDRGDGIEKEAVYKSPSAESLFMDKLAREQISVALAALPQPQRRRVEAYVIHDMTYQAIAEAEGVDESAIRASVKRALRTMKKYLQNFN